MKEIEQIRWWAVLMYQELDEELDCHWVQDQLAQQAEIETCTALDNPV